MARVYATSAEAWPAPATPPANADVILRAASRVVDTLLTGVVYDTDVDGYPTDLDTVQALRDATVAVALEAEATGVLDAGSTQQWDSVSIGSVSMSGPRANTADSDVVTVGGLAVPPLAILALAGLGRPVVWVQ